MVDQTLSHYRVLEQVGAGGMGIVYRAHDQNLDRDVAIKVLSRGLFADDDSRRRFLKEAQSLARLNHPNIAIVHEYGVQDGLDFIVTEYIPGVTMDARLSHGRLPYDEILRLGKQLADGLEAAHEQGVVHCDLKPGNLRVTPKGQLKILDFGLARFAQRVSETALTESVTERRTAMGTLPYMAPEQLRGKAVDRRCDIWATGAVLYEMATGKRAFPERESIPLMEAILHEAPKPPREVNRDIAPGLESVILKALDKNPDQRYQSAQDLRVDLLRLASAEMPVYSSASSRVSHSSAQRIMRSRWLTPVIGAILVAMAVGLIAFRDRALHSTIPAPPKQQVLAILPFDELGTDSEARALGNGITETLTAKLAELSNNDSLQLVSAREMRAQQVTTADQARREFGVDLVLEGSMQKSGDQVRINCSLVDPKTRRQVRGGTVTADASDIFGLEDKVVSQVLEILQIGVPEEQKKALAAHSGANPAAYEYYLRGRGYLEEYQRPENIDNAIAEFKRAIAIDSNYGPAYAGLGEAYWRGFDEFNRGDDWVQKATESCQRALAESSGLAEAHACLGYVYNSTGQYSKAVDEFQYALALDRYSADSLKGLASSYEQQSNLSGAETAYREAIALRPNYWGGYSGLGAFFFRQSRYSDAIPQFQKVTQLAPENTRGYTNLGATYVALGQYSDSIDVLKRSIAIRPTMDAYSDLGTAYFQLHRFAEAADTYQKGLALDKQDWLIWGNLADALYWTPKRRKEALKPYKNAISLCEAKLKVNPNDAYPLAFLASYHAMLDKKQAALKVLNQAIAQNSTIPEVSFRVAVVYNHFGDTDDTLTWLEKALKAGYSKSMVQTAPDFEALHDDPKFQALLQ
jgi:serine/threonine protein kinase/tetratricopeptide (TPR) repeat protein